MANEEAIEVVLKARYYQPGESTWGDICKRVADFMAPHDVRQNALYRTMMETKRFIPNSPVLFNYGTKHPMGSACFALKVDDNIDSIYTALHETAKVFKMGGGVGFNFSKIRPAGSPVQGTSGVASGVISFMKLFDASTEVIKQGGKRRGAGIAILNVDHPEIEEFIECKNEEGVLTNFNISVMVTDKFMAAVASNRDWNLVFDGKVVKTVKARELYDKICTSIWIRAEPGLLFYDTINLHQLGPQIDTTNPCGEQPLLPYESCVLGSINMVAMLRHGAIDYDLLRETVYTAVEFLDDVIDKNEYPLPEIADMTKKNRKIGLGIMGFADMLIQLGVRYDDSPEVLKGIDDIMAFIKDAAKSRSNALGARKGSYPNKAGNEPDMRNATRLAIAPTGTISMIAGVSSGIEPNFSYVYDRKNSLGSYLQVHEQFEKDLQEECKHQKQYRTEARVNELEFRYVINHMHEKGTIQDILWLSDKFKHKYVTAIDVLPEAHIAIQAAFQKHVDSSISKTINCPESTTVSDIKCWIENAWDQNLKGLTFYRQNSRQDVVLNLAKPVENYHDVEDMYKDEPEEVDDLSRPRYLPGGTFKIKSGCGKLYITINHMEGRLYECFVNTGGSGGCSASNESLGRTISLLLRNDVSLDSISKQLGRVSCPAAIKGKCEGKSCSDIVGKSLLEGYGIFNKNPKPSSGFPDHILVDDAVEFNQKYETNINVDKDGGFRINNIMMKSGVCPDCGADIVKQEGCIMCLSCGWSRC